MVAIVRAKRSDSIASSVPQNQGLETWFNGVMPIIGPHGWKPNKRQRQRVHKSFTRGYDVRVALSYPWSGCPAMLPSVVAFLLCDSIQRDMLEKLSLCGLFNRINVAAFPVTVHNSCLYCALTGGRAEVSVTLRLVDAAEIDGEPVITTSVPVRFKSPLDVVEVVLQFAALTFPTPGTFAWQVECDGETVFTRRIIVDKNGG